ncbi:MAG: PqqD family protein [Thermomonas sp.]|nr:PqqD family protein [Thermomonas sp.]
MPVAGNGLFFCSVSRCFAMSGTVASMEHRRLRRSPDALATQVDGDIMMLVLSTGMYHSLSGVAARIWEVLETPSTLDEISARIAEEYGVSLEQCRMDTQAFLADLSRAGLVDDFA